MPSDNSFPAACRQTLDGFILSVASHLRKRRPADIFLDFTTSTASIFIIFLDDVSSALSFSSGASSDLAVVNYMKSHPDSGISNMSDPEHQAQKLQLVADDILSTYLDPVEYQCPPARLFLRHMLAEVILGMTLDRCAKAEYLNDWIVYLLDENEGLAKDSAAACPAGSTHEEPSIKSKTESAQPSESSDGNDRNNERKRAVSAAEEAMDEAMKEAQRLTKLMLEEDARRLQQNNEDTPRVPAATNNTDASSIAAEHSRNGTSLYGSSNEINNAETGSNEHQDDALPVRTSVEEVQEIGLGTDERPDLPVRPAVTLSLHGAEIAIFDDGVTVGKGLLKTKPQGEYLLQISPSSSSYSGWVITRTYADFETLHEVLRRISTVSGTSLNSTPSSLPSWKALAKDRLTGELERYLGAALQSEQLAESEGMKRFLDKERGLGVEIKPTAWTTPGSVGKGMLDVLTRAPKDVAGGGKALLGGVTGALSTVNPLATKRPTGANRTTASYTAEPKEPNGRASLDSMTSWSENEIFGKTLDVESPKSSPEPRRSSSSTRPLTQTSRLSSRLALSTQVQDEALATSSPKNPHKQLPPSRASASAAGARLPPQASSSIADDYLTSASRTQSYEQMSSISADGTSFFDVPTPSTSNTPLRSASPSRSQPSRPATPPPPPSIDAYAIDTQQPAPREDPTHAAHRPRHPLTSREAQAATDVLFAATTQLFALSSAWAFRRTLLAAAKAFLLRPGNPQLETLRALMQGSAVDALASADGIATALHRVRAAALPTEPEREAWPPERTDEEREQLRRKARRLLCERGMPAALTGVMGQAASAEALGKLFDCLQVEKVARGLVFAVLLQALRVLVQ